MSLQKIYQTTEFSPTTATVNASGEDVFIYPNNIITDNYGSVPLSSSLTTLELTAGEASNALTTRFTFDINSGTAYGVTSDVKGIVVNLDIAGTAVDDLNTILVTARINGLGLLEVASDTLTSLGISNTIETITLGSSDNVYTSSLSSTYTSLSANSILYVTLSALNSSTEETLTLSANNIRTYIYHVPYAADGRTQYKRTQLRWLGNF